MTYEEWKSITRLMLDFDSLSEQAKESIFLMMDGLKYRSKKETLDGRK